MGAGGAWPPRRACAGARARRGAEGGAGEAPQQRLSVPVRVRLGVGPRAGRERHPRRQASSAAAVPRRPGVGRGGEATGGAGAVGGAGRDRRRSRTGAPRTATGRRACGGCACDRAMPRTFRRRSACHGSGPGHPAPCVSHAHVTPTRRCVGSNERGKQAAVSLASIASREAAGQAGGIAVRAGRAHAVARRRRTCHRTVEPPGEVSNAAVAPRPHEKG